MFVEFIALIFLSYIKKYTIQELFYEFDVVECFEQPGHELRLNEITKRQAELYQAIEISPPSLQ